jgi:hypothetical protein
MPPPRLRRAMKRFGLVVAVLLHLSITAAGAWPLATSSWRCGPRIVAPGQTTQDVYERCGEPTERGVSTELVTVRVARDVAVTRPVTFERWIYDRGSNQFVRFLTFRDDVLIAIDEGSYGASR